MNYIVLDIVLSNSLSSKYQTYIWRKKNRKKMPSEANLWVLSFIVFGLQVHSISRDCD